MSERNAEESDHSPGAIEPSELLLRAIFYPDHVDQSGILCPEAISCQDLCKRGFSVYRKAHVTRDKLTRVIRGYKEKKSERDCRGIAEIAVCTVIALTDTENRSAFTVTPDAKTEDERAHAAITFTIKYSPSVQKSLRKKLLDQIGALKQYSEILNALSRTE